MRQVIQSNLTGELKVEEVPPPALQAGGVLVANHFSLISAGTEQMAVQAASESLVSKARRRPEAVKQVIFQAMRQGVRETMQVVRGRLDKPLALGYSAAGKVIAVGRQVDDLQVGDPVACAGAQYAHHAEVIYVPRNLCVPIPAGVSFEQAAYVTLGAIALQGVRIADVQLGESVAVIGLGLLGQLTVQLLKAAGCQVLGIDVDAERVALARTLGADRAVVRDEEGNAGKLAASFSRGYGVDAVIITAATSSNDPVELAAAISRDKGRVVIVGAVGMNLPREPFYAKELDLRLSRSYGPGRYDPRYEEQGIDYPYGYVRWTEGRNMAAFLQLIAQGKIDPSPLTTHVFPVERAPQAYDLITGKIPERYMGILLQYPSEISTSARIVLAPRGTGQLVEKVCVGFIGAGDFARNVLLPRLQHLDGVSFRTLVTATGMSARYTGQRFGFATCATDPAEVMNDPAINTVFIATPHHLHAPLVVDALVAGKHVFVEKPLALNQDELSRVVKAFQGANEQIGKAANVHSPVADRQSPILMVGFNRRFAPLIHDVKRFIDRQPGPRVIIYRVNAGFIPRDHWIQDPERGGGRIIGEVCHFVDLMAFLVGALPMRVYAEAVSWDDAAQVNEDTLLITLKFSNGSTGMIAYLANGDRGLPKERIEIFGGSSVAIVDDFRGAHLIAEGTVKKIGGGWLAKQDKGHEAELAAFVRAVRQGEPSPVPLVEAVAATQTTFAIIESLRTGEPILLNATGLLVSSREKAT